MGDTQNKVEETPSQDIKICFSCYKVNGDDDRWLLMGDLSISSNANFSHGLCPDCYEQMKMNLKKIPANPYI